TLLLVGITIVTVPITLTSMRDVLGRVGDPVYDLFTGRQVTGAEAEAAAADAIYVNLGLIDLNEGSGQITIAVSGNRHCAGACPALALTLTALDVDVEQRRGLPPSARLTLTPADRVFSQSVQLPVRGEPSLYPFDEYLLWLGVAGVATAADGTTQELDPATVAAAGTVTVQNRISDLVMPPPVPINPDVKGAASDPTTFLALQSVRLERPAYLPRMTVTLILLIAISAVLAVFTRGFSELLLGIGGLILGVWGVRSVLMPQPVPAVTTIDLALSWVIFLLLVGLALRAVMHFYRHSDLPAPPWAGNADGA
ncbi:MAG TPA: hypothetical protein VHJ83_11395, partial [Micromonosporaceae bacterium]|nr:hypothetical protein [Micromonosporaceae bacterium]